jgi:FkbM family methyltransferase
MKPSFIEWLVRLASNTLFVLRKGHSHGRSRVLAALWRIECRRLASRVLGFRPRTERLFGATIEFFDYETFATLFEEIYIGEMYRVTLDTPTPYILDCGANVGMSILYFKTLFPGARIRAFEADPETFAVLERNVRRNDWHDVDVMNVAVAAKAGRVRLHTGGTSGGLSHAIVASPFVHEGTVEVRSEQLSNSIDAPVHVLKMDIEGAEDEVFEELENSGALAQVENLLLEYHHHLSGTVDRFGAFLARLERAGLGYQIRANLALPFEREAFQCFIMYAYRKRRTELGHAPE